MLHAFSHAGEGTPGDRISEQKERKPMLCCERQVLIFALYKGVACFYFSLSVSLSVTQLVKLTSLAQAYFDTQATHIQRWFRGFWSRKYIHNFQQRKAFLAAVAESNARMRDVAEQQLQASIR